MKRVQKMVSIILPTFNESESIISVIKECKRLKRFFPTEIIVVDGGSTDNTAKLAAKEKIKVVKFKTKRGKGADFWAGVKIAKGEYIVQIDADNQFFPSEIPIFIKSLERGADVAIADRTHRPTDAPWIRVFGNKIFVIIASIVLRRRIYDLVAGFKAFKKSVLLSLDLKEPHFGYEAEVVAKAIIRGYNVVQIPVSYQRRKAGESQVKPLRDGILTILSLLKARFGLI